MGAGQGQTAGANTTKQSSYSDPIGFLNAAGQYSGMGPSAPMGQLPTTPPPTGIPNTPIHFSGAALTAPELAQYNAQQQAIQPGSYVAPLPQQTIPQSYAVPPESEPYAVAQTPQGNMPFWGGPQGGQAMPQPDTSQQMPFWGGPQQAVQENPRMQAMRGLQQLAMRNRGRDWE